ncbi:hypothetical protein FOL47_003723 [Perkinsus chesapeaki]|uniref:Uncharacterized protein n=1 Tax=Perkinsus chesapeaki TaxID=330153 RepID=A0A7J6M6E4_PERCH|nr:hypothetical protein FOL47_003723 [Perkinsus chesapeaki]
MLSSLSRTAAFPTLRRSFLPLVRRIRPFSSLVFTRDHEWISTNDDHVATIGVSDFAQDEIGELVYVDLPSVGSVFNKDEVLCTLESVKAVEEVLCPLDSGTVVETNMEVEETPDLVNADPEHDGWLLKMQYHGSIEPDGKNYFTGDEYHKAHEPSFDRHSPAAGHCLLSDFEVDFLSGLICDTGYSLVEDSMTTTAPVRKKARTPSLPKVDLNLIIPSSQRRSCTATTSKSEGAPSSSSAGSHDSTPEKVSRRGRKKTATSSSGMPEFERNEYRRLVQHMVRMNKELAAPFMKPVPKWVPGYYEMITVPVDISMILNRLDSWFYGSRADFEADMRQMFVNAYTFNQPGSLEYDYALELHSIFNTMMTTALDKVLQHMAEEHEREVQSAVSSGRKRKRRST